MSAVFDLNDGERFGSTGPAPPQVFTRVFSLPAGAPWEQARAAKLEVRHGSPLPIQELVWRLRRLAAWRFGQPARYAVFYVRSREAATPFETVVEVDGAPIRVAFGVDPDRFQRLRRLVLVSACIAGCVIPVAIGTWLALQTRADTSDRLASLERSLAAKSRLAGKVQLERRQARELEAAVGSAGRMQDVLDDFAWATSAKAPEARILALHWDHGLLAIEARGDSAPLEPAGRVIERSSKPLRPGVWLWGVKKSAAAPADLTP